jgi:hypothetical protein
MNNIPKNITNPEKRRVSSLDFIAQITGYTTTFAQRIMDEAGISSHYEYYDTMEVDQYMRFRIYVYSKHKNLSNAKKENYIRENWRKKDVHTSIGGESNETENA